MYLIPERWYAVVASNEVRPRQSFAARRLGHDMVFWRDRDGGVAAALDHCPHRGAALSPGKVVDGCVECPFHGFRFEADGTCSSIPAHPNRRAPRAMRLRTLQAREAHGLVWLWTGEGAAPNTSIPFFDFDGWTWAGSQITEDVKTHYTRAIENQLDFAHLPFVHKNTIGRFARNGEVDVHMEIDGDRLLAHIGEEDGVLEFLGPNIWRLKTGPAYQFVAFAPVDENNMRYYLRSYRRSTWAPLDFAINRLGAQFSKIVIGEDTRVVETQPPDESRLRMDEVLVPSDRPILAYRTWREALREAWAPHEARPPADVVPIRSRRP